MRMQVEPVAEAVVMEVEDQVTATGTAFLWMRQAPQRRCAPPHPQKGRRGNRA